MGAQLNLMIVFRRRTETNTGSGITTVWADIGRAWAHRADGVAGEGEALGGLVARIAVRFVVRRNALTLGLTARDAIMDRGRAYQISGIRQMDRADLLEITAEARADQ